MRVLQMREAVMRNMGLKSCVWCAGSAHCSVAFVVSTIGVSPRRQKCSAVVLICDACIRELCDADPQIPEVLQNALKRAYTALNSAPADHAQRSENEL